MESMWAHYFHKNYITKLLLWLLCCECIVENHVNTINCGKSYFCPNASKSCVVHYGNNTLYAEEIGIDVHVQTLMIPLDQPSYGRSTPWHSANYRRFTTLKASQNQR